MPEGTPEPFKVKNFLALYPELIQNWQNRTNQKLITNEVNPADFSAGSELLKTGNYDPIASKEHIELVLDFYESKHENFKNIKADWKRVDSSSILTEADIASLPQ